MDPRRAVVFANTEIAKGLLWGLYTRDYSWMKLMVIVLFGAKRLRRFQPTWADFAVGEMVTRLESCCDSLVLKEYPTLKDHAERVDRLPRIKSYVANRSYSLF